MLFTAEAFEPLGDETWDETRAREGIREIVADTDAALRGPTRLWQAHDWDRWHATSPMKNLYVGASGVLWALDGLQKRGHAETALDLGGLAQRTLELFRARPDLMKGMKLPEPPESALFTGETGILLVAWRLATSTALADELFERVQANTANATDELFWGVPGTLLAARAMLDWTEDERWRDAWLESANGLWSRRDRDGFWVQRLYGQESRGLSASHGLVGNALALIRGGELLDPERHTALVRDTRDVLARTAVVEEGRANWPHRDRLQLDSLDGQIRLQWCSGGAGIVVAAGSYLDEELLLAGAELVWEAGPHALEKGACICHGTAGNGYALLKAFERTRDEVWLERARRFAMHALGQVRRLRAERGRGRYSLWTGDIGTALFLADCVDARTSFPVLDSWDW